MMTDKMRVHILAKELSVPSKVIIEKCKAEGITTVKNHMSTLSAGLHATIREWFSDEGSDTTVETSQRVDLEKVRIKRRRKKTTDLAAGNVDQPEVVESGISTTVAEPAAVAVIAEAPPEAAVADGVSTSAVEPAEVAIAVAVDGTPATMEPPAPTLPEQPDQTITLPTETEPGLPEVAPEVAPAEPQLDQAAAEAPKPAPKTLKPVGPQNVPGKAKLQGPRVVRYESPDYDAVRPRRPPATPRRVAPGAAPTPERPAGPAPTTTRRKGRLSPRRAAGNVADAGERLAEWRDQDLLERKERLAGATGRRIHRRRSVPGTGAGGHPVPAGPKTKATVNEPVRMKDFCSATGLNFLQCLKILKNEHNLVANVNMTLPVEIAELLALDFGIELTVVPCKTLLDEVREEFAERSRNHLELRPPVVTMLGHVDHGKTSLLDAIRNARVVAGEDGGITQHVGAYHVETAHGAVTFLDTPGHEAFTAMRARGAELTDVVVLVVAADDGVMRQTIEAINHAKTAEVPIVVALNKIDVGEQNKLKIYGQLSEHGVTPSGEWGGDVDVIPTSATTGTGVQELVEHLANLSSLMELKADRTLPATGTVIEAETKPGVGAVARILPQEGVLRVGSFVVCGPAFGKIRALLDDRGQRLSEAGPSIPVELWGLDEVPAAGDQLFVLTSLQRAKGIASETKQSRLERSRLRSRKAKSLEDIFLQRNADSELNLIIKADVDGSLAALRQTLGKLPTDEVRLTIRHDAVGAVNDSDILLAAACKGIVVAFRVDTAAGVKRLAERHGVEVRPYRVIYDVHDEVKKALEGLLAPEERIESHGKAEVREIFRLSRKAGVVSGSYVTEGIINRGHLAKVIRDGVVVREGCKFASLRRFKDDVKEVRAGLECGIRLERFDDTHVGDIIEAYEIVKVARTL